MKNSLNFKKKLVLALSVLMLSVPTLPGASAGAIAGGTVAGVAAVGLTAGLVHRKHKRERREGIRRDRKFYRDGYDQLPQNQNMNSDKRYAKNDMSAGKKYANNDMSKNNMSKPMNKKQRKAKIAQLQSEINNLEANS